MNERLALLAAILVFPILAAAQEHAIITMNQEPHHHLVFQNAFVNVYDAQAAPGESLLLHRHDHDAIAIAIGDQLTTVGIPGKPDVHSKNADGQVRMQRSGYVHSTHVDGDTNYFTVAIELLRPQTGAHNLCAAVLADQPLHCPAPSPEGTLANYTEVPQFESNQTYVRLVRVSPLHTVGIADLHFIIALDPALLSAPRQGGAEMTLHPGDYVWFDKAGSGRRFENKTDKDVRFIELTFKP